jgi:hypothetical protein
MEGVHMSAKSTKKKAKARKHKPDWPLMFADRIIDLENRVAAIERTLAELNAKVV